ncbi:MAG: AAA family ATPase [bacterium]|nr:AAA family ATPase [bacterium]
MSLPLLPAEVRLYFTLERRWPFNSRERILKYAERVILVLLLVVLTGPWFNLISAGTIDLLLGLDLLVLASWTLIYASLLFSRYQHSALLAGVHPHLPGANYFTAAAVSAIGYNDNLLAGYFKSPWRKLVEQRLGLLNEFDFDNESLVKDFTVPTDFNMADGLSGLIAKLLPAAPAYSEALRRVGVTSAEAVMAGAWVELIEREHYAKSAWWRPEHLATIPGLAKDWHYGETYELEQFGRFIIAASPAQNNLYLNECEAVERVLLRSREANAILTGDHNVNLTILTKLASRLVAGLSAPQLEGRRLFLLEVGRLLAAFEHQPGLPEKILTLANTAVSAGNIILIIDDLPRLAAYLTRLGAPLSTLLDDYLSGASLTVIGLADNAAFHAVLEPDAVLMNRFEVVKISSPGADNLFELLIKRLGQVEDETELFFTYPAARAISQSVESYFDTGSPEAELEDLLSELVPYLLKRGERIVTKEAVISLVREKTNIPMGEVGAAEREKLLSLEEQLKKRVIGQDRALTLVSGALRRARAETRSTNRPVATFLFLGPTGVGKTETAKAVSALLFGREDALLRLDMSEFASPDSLNRLIGDFTTGAPGVLAKLVREHPYGVLLLDEFEKTDREVLNLFLQIFDEGFFSDMSGRRVNLRSLLIIATSNAGADLVWELMKTKTTLAGEESEIIDTLIKRGIFKPELLNRFDAVVLYEPLSTDSLGKIARLQLKRLAKRLEEQDVKLNITDGLVTAIVEQGANAQFGARPMQRLIQDTVEEEVAKALIAGTLKAGQTASLVPTKTDTGNLLGLTLRVE